MFTEPELQTSQPCQYRDPCQSAPTNEREKVHTVPLTAKSLALIAITVTPNLKFPPSACMANGHRTFLCRASSDFRLWDLMTRKGKVLSACEGVNVILVRIPIFLTQGVRSVRFLHSV